METFFQSNLYFLFFLLTKGYQKIQDNKSVVELKCYTATYVILDLQNHFVYIRTVTLHLSSQEISLAWSHQLDQPPNNSRGILLNDFYYILIVCYLKLRHIFSLLKRMHLVFSSPKQSDSLLSAKHSHTFSNFLFKIFLMLIKNVSVTCMQVSNEAYHLYIDEISFVHSKNSKSPDIDPRRTLHSMVPASKSTLSNETR